jgi:sRNA-binding protein
VKSGTITLAQLRGKPKEVEKPVVVKQKQDNKQIAREAFLKRKAQRKELRMLLNATYPEVFNFENPKPLAIGIDRIIKSIFPQFSHKTLKFFMNKWVQHPKYLKSLLASEQRVDLDNQASSPITEVHKKIAQDMLDKKKPYSVTCNKQIHGENNVRE